MLYLQDTNKLRVNLALLEDYKQSHLLRSQKHNTLPLLIWNYTEKVQYDSLWDEVTTACRGLITDTEGYVIAKPFSKFFNIEQNRHEEAEDFQIYEKLDGSLGILFYYADSWHIATRGSFHSDQAITAMEILREQNFNFKHLETEHTYCLEIIYPENRICVSYGDVRVLKLIGVFEIQSHQEAALRVKEHSIELFRHIFEVCKTYDFTDYTEIQKLDWQNSEGFIVRFSNGSRCKIKFQNYVDLHRKLSHITQTAVWELICEKQPLETYLDILPDEYHKTVKDWYHGLTQQYKDLQAEVEADFDTILTELGAEFTKKDFALKAVIYKHSAMLFSLLNKKDIHEAICKVIKPVASKALMFTGEEQ